MKYKVINGVFITVLMLMMTCQAQKGDPVITEIWRPIPAKVTPGIAPVHPPSDAFILYGSSKDSSQWLGAKSQNFGWMVKDNYITVKPGAGDIRTKRGFGSCQLHIEWQTPHVVKGDGQGRGNSGILIMGRYELQVLDSYNNSTYSNGQAGSIYKQKMPMVNACKPPGEWQTYDAVFTAPVFNSDSTLLSPAKITVFHNGVLIHHNFELWGSTAYIGIPKYEKHSAKEPLILQDHGNPVSFRNIWIREL